MTMATFPKYMIVEWGVKPTEYDPIGCDGMYLKSVKIKWWGWPIILFKAGFKSLRWHGRQELGMRQE